MESVTDRVWGRIMSLWVILLIVLYASLALLGDYKEVYNMKAVLSSYAVLGITELDTITETNGWDFGKASIVELMEMAGPSIRGQDAEVKRNVAIAFGETDLRYHLKLKSGNFVPSTLDLSSNALYNFSYMVNVPSKLSHNLKQDFALEKLFIGENASKLDKAHGKFVVWLFVAWDVLHAFTGLVAAFMMLFVGSLLGLICHPLQSLTNFLPSLWQVIVTTWHAISYFTHLFR